MYKTAAKRHLKNAEYDLYADLAKIKDAFADVAYDVKGKAGDALAQGLANAREKSTDIQDTLATYTSERPFKSIGIALVIGAALGFLVRK